MKYKKKPVVIEAFQWTGDVDQIEDPSWIIDALSTNKAWFVNTGTPAVCLLISTSEGDMTAQVGDYIIQGIKGELYPCKPDIFEATYEKVGGTKGENRHLYPVLKYFQYEHLPVPLQETSKAFHDLAEQMMDTVKDGPEKSVGLRKLLEAKDAFVRANL